MDRSWSRRVHAAVPTLVGALAICRPSSAQPSASAKVAEPGVEPTVEPTDGKRTEAPTAARVIWRLRLDSGAEVDTNIHRVERIDGDEQSVVTAPLVRSGARADVSYGWRKMLVAVGGRGTSKLFLSPAGQSENVAAGNVDADVSRRVGTDGAAIAARLSYYNAGGLQSIGEEEVNLGRAFVTASGELMATVPGPEQHRVVAAFGYRDFVYKPDNDFDWRGEHVRLAYRNTIWRGDPETEKAASIELGAAYVLGRRGYRGPAFANSCAPDAPVEPQCFMPTESLRSDLNHAVSVTTSYTGERIYSARYELQANDSNSFGQSLIRQRLELSLTSEVLGSGVFATAKVAVLFNHFLDPLLLARDVNSQTFDSIDDENRNSASLHASRQLGGGWSLEARYALFTNEFATQERTFRRQTLYGGLVYELR